MKSKSRNLNDLNREVESFKDSYPSFSPDSLFILWFMRAYITDDLELAARSVTGKRGDKGIDSIFLDEKAKMVFAVQGKYRESIFEKIESRTDVLDFANLASKLCGEKEIFNSFIHNLTPEIKVKVNEARERIVKRGYKLHLYYVTLGKCSSVLEKEAIDSIKRLPFPAKVEIIDGRRLMLLLADYLEGVAPPVPSVELEIEAGSGVRVSAALQRYDQNTDIESWVFPMSGSSIAEIYGRSGTRIFARNVRGFLADTEVNLSMEKTIEKEPGYFWYYNNGITIICDKAERRGSKGKEILYVENPQIINGQQTTRTLFKRLEKASKTSVIVKVIRVTREHGQSHEEFEKLISSIVAATNWQNAILQSDLMSNDRMQIELERELRKASYLYLRKRQSRSEAKSHAGENHFHTITKEEMAKAVAACDLDPSIFRRGKEILFEENNYKTIFSSSNVNYYLNRYWLFKRIKMVTKGYRERGHAIWLITNFMWSRIGGSIKSDAASKTFQDACRYYTDISASVEEMAVLAFRSASIFYKRKKGEGENEIELSSFFRLKNIVKDFNSFWKGSSNKYRVRFNKKESGFRSLINSKD
jgi:hypothetical protein